MGVVMTVAPKSGSIRVNAKVNDLSTHRADLANRGFRGVAGPFHAAFEPYDGAGARARRRIGNRGRAVPPRRDRSRRRLC